MKFKNVIILIILLILSLSIGVVSASDSADLNTDINTVNTEHNNINTDINTVNTEDDELKINNTTYSKNDISKINIKPILEDEYAKNINNSNKVNTTVKTKTVYVKTSDVINAAISLKSFVKKNKALDIKIGKIQVNTIQFSYLMTEAIKNIKNKKLSSKIKVIDVKIKVHTVNLFIKKLKNCLI